MDDIKHSGGAGEPLGWDAVDKETWGTIRHKQGNINISKSSVRLRIIFKYYF